MGANLIDFSLKRCHGYNTAVFWDIDDCPIPDGLSVSDVSQNIREALKNMGCRGGQVDILVYGDTNKILVDGQVPVGIHKVHYIPKGDEDKRRRGVMDGILFWVLANKHRLSNLMLIIGDISDNSMLLSFLHTLAFAGHNFLIAQDPECKRIPIHHDLRFEWRWPDLGHGSAPVFIEQVPDRSRRRIPSDSESDPQVSIDINPDLEEDEDDDESSPTQGSSKVGRFA